MKKLLLSMAAMALSLAAAADNYYLVGDFQGWSPDTAPEFTAGENGVYTVAVESLTTGFKIIDQRAWGGTEYASSGVTLGVGEAIALEIGGGNIEFNPNIKSVANATLTFNPTEMTLLMEGEATIEEVSTYYLVGGFNNWDAGAAPEFTAVGDGTYTITVETMTTGFKIIDRQSWGGPEWASAGGTMKLNEPFALQIAGSNIDFDPSILNVKNCVFIFNPEAMTLYMTGDATFGYPDLWLVGSNWNGWAAPGNEGSVAMTCNEGIYTCKADMVADCEFKICGSGWSPEFCFGADNTPFADDNLSQQLSMGGSNMKASLEGTYDLTFNYDTLYLTFIKDDSGVKGIEAENGEAVYFNLQGVRVSGAEKGLYIKVQNGKATKTIR